MALTDEHPKNLPIKEKLWGQFEQVITNPFNPVLIRVATVQNVNYLCLFAKTKVTIDTLCYYNGA